MANAEHLEILEQGVKSWNTWREDNKSIKHPDLSGIDLSGRSLNGINFRGANLTEGHFTRCDLDGSDLSIANLAHSNFSGVSLFRANLIKANCYKTNFSVSYLSEANLKSAILNEAEMENVDFSRSNLNGASFVGSLLKKSLFENLHLIGTNFTNANLNSADFSKVYMTRVDLSGANLSRANFKGANLKEVNLSRALLLGTDFSYSNISNSRIYGISVWDVKKEGAVQKDLIITKDKGKEISVDDLEIAQFIYLLLNNEKFRDVIETVTSKAVLILGRFTDERLKVLNAIREELRKRNFLPILFDFEKPATRDLTETISILAKLSRFVIADLTDAKSIPQELSQIVPHMPSLPVIPLILKGQREYGMFEHWPRYPWVLPIFEYENEAHLIKNLIKAVIEPAENKVQEIRSK